MIHGADGLDEISGEAPTDVVQFDRSGVRRWTLDPSDYGVHATRAEIRGGDAATNAAALLAILEGERSPRADLVLPQRRARARRRGRGGRRSRRHGPRAPRRSRPAGARAALEALRGGRAGDRAQMQGGYDRHAGEALCGQSGGARGPTEAREPLDVLRERARGRRGRRRFRAALANARGPAIVAEIKRASPSVGLIVPHLDPAEIARAYEASGADAISVLTEADHFLGDLAYLDVARSATSLPILRKDFLCTAYEVVQSAAYGADAILAILAGVTDQQLAEMMEQAKRFELDILVEVHTEAELRRALDGGRDAAGDQQPQPAQLRDRPRRHRRGCRSCRAARW